MHELESSSKQGQQKSSKEPNVHLQSQNVSNAYSFFSILRKSPSTGHIGNEDTLSNFVKRLKNYIDTNNYIENIDYVETPDSEIEDLSSSMSLPAKMRAAIENIVLELQRKINAGELCNKETQKLLIYNYQHFACYDEEMPGYSLEMMIQDKNDKSRKLTGDRLSLVVLENCSLLDEDTYLKLLDENEMRKREQPGMYSIG